VPAELKPPSKEGGVPELDTGGAPIVTVRAAPVQVVPEVAGVIAVTAPAVSVAVHGPGVVVQAAKPVTVTVGGVRYPLPPLVKVMTTAPPVRTAVAVAGVPVRVNVVMGLHVKELAVVIAGPGGGDVTVVVPTKNASRRGFTAIPLPRPPGWFGFGNGGAPGRICP
jgi:hypothetical protein